MTERDQQVLCLYREGKKMKEIAVGGMGRSENSHLSRHDPERTR